jgi:hypothetical protein
MIPRFSKTGLLPPGIHVTAWEEFADRFVKFQQSDQRLRLGRHLGLLFDEARKSGIVRRFFVGGSYVTDKAVPNDFDCLLVIDSSVVGTLMPPFRYNLTSRRMARRMYNGDVTPVIEDSSAFQEYLEFFQTTRDGERTGIIEIQL